MLFSLKMRSRSDTDQRSSFQSKLVKSHDNWLVERKYTFWLLLTKKVVKWPTRSYSWQVDRKWHFRAKSQWSWLLTNFYWNDHRWWVSPRDRIFSENQIPKLRWFDFGHIVNFRDFWPEIVEHVVLGSNSQFWRFWPNIDQNDPWQHL